MFTELHSVAQKLNGENQMKELTRQQAIEISSVRAVDAIDRDFLESTGLVKLSSVSFIDSEGNYQRLYALKETSNIYHMD